MNQPVHGSGRRPGFELWLWGPNGVMQPVPAARPDSTPVRIGDSERDDAVASLGDHFAAGRLTRDELDERIDQAMQARYNRDLEPLFVDLPTTTSGPGLSPPSTANQAGVRTAVPAILAWLAPLLVVAVVVGAVALQAPWLLWAIVWMMIASRSLGRRRNYRTPGHRHDAQWQDLRPGGR